ncbi:MAG: protein tyrosine phosphatase [Sulfuricurvum sp. GWF2_44_89]|uniref:protein-tyrosine-phosphatase n=1 Tax=Sulfuricurvum kujiense TaxID=148813 RepID=A0A2D3WDI1_9BACT|nr:MULTISPECIES: low molecular weight protein-tyrosine-phosphatase [Sulfuricurvum]OHD77731.1 MAG: protein tyrosine phosphatase [Sulfuricurvum sp. GWF2_44_89]OHD90830.1 MAG: protein tyrosine phosphatase [Sulfuricurvum sp. RIFOXYD12_FULL_44_77]OHD92547.1 MAG: protein tyrosine phosphatase [Sulfuricurvum sp. RIFOXYD2_FULL_44_160]DAB39361.1 MAG TPA: protein tyrosine phosphatase [Sulfuricurvum kujiense]
MRSILFVCLGNICRSPIAEGVARKLIEEDSLTIAVDSAGTGSWHVGETPCKHSITVAKKHDIDISHLRARQVKKADFSTFDLIVALDESNYRDLKSLGCQNLVKLGDYGHEGADVPDPYFFDGFEGFEHVYTMIESCVCELLHSHL